MLGGAENTVADVMLIMRPRPEPFSIGKQAVTVLNTPVTFTAKTFSHSSTLKSSNGPRVTVVNRPALLTRMSSPPNLTFAAATAASTCWSLVTSMTAPKRRPSLDLHSAANSSLSRISPATTLQPRVNKPLASSSPIPDPAPVTKATLSLRSAIGSSRISNQIIMANTHTANYLIKQAFFQMKKARHRPAASVLPSESTGGAGRKSRKMPKEYEGCPLALPVILTEHVPSPDALPRNATKVCDALE